MLLRNRPALARLGAASLLAAGAVAAVGAPAHAAGTVDYKVSLAGTTIAAGADFKLGQFKIANVGSAAPAPSAEVDVHFDLSDLDLSMVTLAPELLEAAGLECAESGANIYCTMPTSALPKAGSSIPYPMPILRNPDAKGIAGVLTVTILVPGDTVEENNHGKANVVLGGSGADLMVVADDVRGLDKNGDPTVEKVKPGDLGVLQLFAMNQGDAVADGLKFTAKLPEHVTVAEDYEGCTVSSDRRQLTCEDKDIQLIPISQDENPDSPDDGISALEFGVAVEVAENAPAPATLHGTVSIAALATKKGEAAIEDASEPQAGLPEFAEVATTEDITEVAQEVAETEVDETDNSDDFAVFVAAPANGGGGGNGGNNGGSGGGLPVTGDNVGVIAGVGGGVLALGVALFLVARRRRVVLVTPGDERPGA